MSLEPGPASTGPGGLETAAPGIELVARRRIAVDPPDVRFILAPGDRPLVEPGEAIAPGSPLAERPRFRRLVEVAATAPGDGPVEDALPGPGAWWHGYPSPGRRLVLRGRTVGGGTAVETRGELLFQRGDRWLLAAGDQAESVDSPVAGIVRDVRPGTAITISAAGRALVGVSAIGDPARGTLDLATGSDGELRPSGIDVGRAGTILVVGARVDAETLTRARAMGVRGIVVAGLTGKDRRDYLASERRQRAGLHRLAPFAVLALDGVLRRPIASPIMSLLGTLAGREVAIVTDPPLLIFDAPDVGVPEPPPGWVRVRHGPWAGREGRWAGAAGIRRFPAGVHLEAAFVRFDDGPPVPVPLGDLERMG